MNIEVHDLKIWTLDQFKENAMKNPFTNMGVQSIFSVGNIITAYIEVDFTNRTIAFVINGDSNWYEQDLTNEGYEKVKLHAINKRMQYITDLCK